jgi:hypothetical protein
VFYDPDAALDQVVEDLEQHVQKVLWPDQKIICRAVHGSELEVLVKVSRRAVLLVMDGPKRAEEFSPVRGSRWFSRLLQRAQCPIVVLPPALQSDAAHYTGMLPARRRKAEELYDTDGTAWTYGASRLTRGFLGCWLCLPRSHTHLSEAHGRACPNRERGGGGGDRALHDLDRDGRRDIRGPGEADRSGERRPRESY